MKKKIGCLLIVCVSVSALRAQSIEPVTLLLAKVIKAVDLKVQQLQNQTLVLQGLEQLAQQELSITKLAEITGWQDQLTQLYKGYFAELKQIKPAIAGAAQIKSILSLQKQVVLEYARFGKESAQTPDYDRLLNTSGEILQTLQMILSSGLSMHDADRICMIGTLKEAMQHCLSSVQDLNKRQQEIIAGKTRMQADIDYIKRLYGIK